MRRLVYGLVLVWCMAVAGLAQETNTAVSPSNGFFRGMASISVGSSYLFRGATFNDGWVLQPCTEVGVGFLTLGAWANYDVNDYAGAVEGKAFSEVDLYALCTAKIGRFEAQAGYKSYKDKYVYLPAAETPEFQTKAEVDEYKADMQATKGAYPKPDLGLEDGAEVIFAMRYHARCTPSIAVYQGVDGCFDGETYVEAGLDHEYYRAPDRKLMIGATLAYIDQEDGESGLSHCLFTHTIVFKHLSATIGFVRDLNEEILPKANEGGPLDIREYASVQWTYGF